MNRPPLFIVMNRHIIAANRKLLPEHREPAVRVTRGRHGQPVYCDSFIIHGPSELLNGVGEPVMPCGATIAIKTTAAMTLVTRGQPDVHLPASEPLDLAA